MTNNNAAYATQRAAFMRKAETDNHEFATIRDPKLRTRIKVADAYYPRHILKGILTDNIS